MMNKKREAVAYMYIEEGIIQRGDSKEGRLASVVRGGGFSGGDCRMIIWSDHG
jgi:hypothetical protein